MQFATIRYQQSFQIVAGNDRAQAGVMVIEPGETQGGSDNRHRGADQWLYVASGHGTIRIEQQSRDLSPGMLVLIERGEAHEIRNTGDVPLETLNFYVPPAFTADGETLPAGESD